MAMIIELILSERTRGDGTPQNVYRRVTQLFMKDGQPIAEHDAHTGENWFCPAEELVTLLHSAYSPQQLREPTSAERRERARPPSSSADGKEEGA